ncbi:hypothetical protein M3Y97_00105300 [Aphelenchoides bicaudatus]|nr:hypothetical protein M3Y97_00105300 [Aphelenchoides bicaudatus]
MKDGSWSVRYFYSPQADQCIKFWYGGCQLDESLNIFNGVQSCESLCVKRPKQSIIKSPSTTLSPPTATTDQLRELAATTTEMSFPVVCLDPFDERRRRPCVYGEWTRRYFYNHKTKACQMFWFDQSCGVHQPFKSRNVFVHLSTCLRACVGINPDPSQLVYPTSTTPAPTTTVQPFHPHLHTQQHSKHKHYHQLPPDHHPSIEVTPNKEQKKSNNEQLIYPESTLATLPPIVKPAPPKSTVPFTEHKTIGVIQAMFTISKTSTRPLSENDILEAPTGKPLTDEDLNLEDLTNLIEGSPNWNTVQEKNVDLTISVDCLAPFDKNLTRSCSNGQQPWRPRYFYDSKQRRCQLYWHDGCFSTSKNNFEDLPACQWTCEGRTLRPSAEHCLDEFDKTYTDNCRSNKYEIRYYFNHQTKSCDLFYYGHCRSSKSKNIFSHYEVCQDLCVSSSKSTVEVCQEPFDPVYRGSCARNGTYAQYYYFDQSTQSCQMFWYGNCQGKSRNVFDNLTTCQWLCEKKREKKIPSHCMDRFDETYRKACNRGAWEKRFYFDHSRGQCTSFWYDGCVGKSQNIFVNELTCKSLCEQPSLPTEATIDAISEETAREKEIYRCLEPLKHGNCSHHYPAYFYNNEVGRCEPFSLLRMFRSVLMNIFDNVCHRFSKIKVEEMPCYLPLSVGHGRQNKTCIRDAGYRFYFNSKYGKCGRFWFFGCGSNKNNFKSYEDCENLCHGNSASKLLEEPKALSACFQEIDPGQCEATEEPKNTTRYAYLSTLKTCKSFEYTNCAGNENNFKSETDCKDFCGSLITPNSDKCIYQPDWGPCNQLRYMWFYNLTSGLCEQFLWGGCGGNPNRFASFELCQVTCEIPSSENDTDICTDKLDRGQWCEPMTNRYYFHQKSKTCKGFHYTGCGASRNNFKDVEDCEDVCIHRRRPTSLLTLASNISADPVNIGASIGKYAGAKPSEKPELERHVILAEDTQRYIKSDGEWLEYNKCIGFRYNVSGAFTRLKSYICLMEEGGSCQVQTLSSTSGEERCYLIKPWLRGEHYYSWFFTIQRRVWKWSPKYRRRQRPQETTASLIILPGVRDCNSLC